MVQPFTTFVRAYRNTFLIVFHVAKHVIEKLLDMVGTNKLGISNRITAHKNNISSFECINNKEYWTVFFLLRVTGLIMKVKLIILTNHEYQAI